MYKIFAFFLLISPAFAYLDPGTGSMLFSSIVALIATLIYTLKEIFYKIIANISSLFGKKIKQENSFKIVFYNEGNQYFSTFYPVLLEMIKRKNDFIYLYSEEDDKIAKDLKDIKSQYIGIGNNAFYYLNTLKADICIMTTPGLDVLQIKRSRGVKHYCHLHHAASGCAGYNVFGVDSFDSVLVPNKYDKEFITELENIRNINSKRVEIIGNPYYEYFLGEIDKLDPNVKINEKTILVSPTWGESGLLTKYGKALLSKLLINDFKVIVRPHPQDVRYNKILLESLTQEFKEEAIEWDYSDSPLNSMYKSDIMISDFSGIIFDFMFLFNKPILTISNQFNNDGKDYIKIDEPLWQISFFMQHTNTLADNVIDNIEDNISSMLAIESYEINQEILENYNPYFGKSSIKVVDTIEDIYHNIGEQNVI